MNVATKWEEVSLKKFQALNAFIMSDVKMTDLDRSIEIYALLTDNPDEARDALLNMTVDQLSAELSKIHFIVNKYKSKVPETEYDIDGNKYTVQLNLRNMTAAQYIDFQNFYKDYEKNQKYIFLCFLIPKGKKYNEGYDVMELAEDLYDKIPITIVTDVMVFFCKLLESLTIATLISSMREMKKLMKKEKDPVKKHQLRKRIVQARQTLNLVKNGTGFVE